MRASSTDMSHGSGTAPVINELIPVTLDIGTDRKASAKARQAALARAASRRRRFVDPATCERNYSEAELEFMNAIQAYKQKSGRTFPTWGEVLEVVRALGYVKSNGAVPAS
jgi:hypothetical protein